MLSDNHAVTYLKDYRPPAFKVESLKLDFQIQADSVQVTSVGRYQRNHSHNQSGELVLDGSSEMLSLISVAIDGRLLSEDDYTLSDETLVIPNCPDEFELSVVTQFDPRENTKLSGLYVSRGNYCTQCESQGFRRITYFQDRPDVMTIFTTSITAKAERYPQMLSNGNLTSDSTADGLRTVVWHDPSLKPCYLFALVVGDFEQLSAPFTTRSGRHVDVHLYVEKGQVAQADFALASILQSMRWDEETFDREYDLDVFMVVAVSDFNYGAMENKGLNIFNTKYILASPETATDQDFIRVQGVIGHEYFHNWSGNRVTCRDWFQISLKEGLTVYRDQRFTMDMFSAGVKRIEDANIIRSIQFVQDSGPMAHPVRPESYMEISNFYTVTVYNKGAEVVRMIATILGKEAFRKALNLYFERHDGQAVTTEDFVKAMEDSSGVDLTQFRLWYSQAGTPRVTVTDEYDEAKQIYRLHFKQHCPDTPGQTNKKAMHIPVDTALWSAFGDALNSELHAKSEHSHVLHLTESEQTFEFEQVESRPVPSLLRGFSAPIRCGYGYDDDQLFTLMSSENDPFAAWQAGQLLMERELHHLVADYQNGAPLEPKPRIADIINMLLLKPDIDPYFCADLITLPSVSYMAEQMDVIDVEALYAARDALLGQLSESVYEACLHQYQTLCADYQAYEPSFEQMARRRLAGRCLNYLVHSGKEEALALCEQHYYRADNLTDKMNALQAINHRSDALRGQLLSAFYEVAKQDALVLDRWFALEASSTAEGALEKIQTLVNHELYEAGNPNRVRSVVGTFSRNMRVLHGDQGAGHTWLADQLLLIDAKNPQVAARVFDPLLHWRKFVPLLKESMHAQLQHLSKQKLSKDLFELVTKAMAGT